VIVERRYKLRLPKEPEEKHGLEFTENPKNWVDKEDVVNEYLYALYPPNSSIGIHAANKREESFCGLPMKNAETVKWGRAKDVATAITCRHGVWIMPLPLRYQTTARPFLRGAVAGPNWPNGQFSRSGTSPTVRYADGGAQRGRAGKGVFR
jgi:hypothetical protein